MAWSTSELCSEALVPKPFDVRVDEVITIVEEEVVVVIDVNEVEIGIEGCGVGYEVRIDEAMGEDFRGSAYECASGGGDDEGRGEREREETWCGRFGTMMKLYENAKGW